MKRERGRVRELEEERRVQGIARDTLDGEPLKALHRWLGRAWYESLSLPTGEPLNMMAVKEVIRRAESAERQLAELRRAMELIKSRTEGEIQTIAAAALEKEAE